MTEFFEIDFIEAGEKGSGDAITLRYREDDGQDTIHVVDGGYTNDGEKIVEHIRKYYGGGSYVDHVVSTHPDNDHSAGLKKVLEELRVGELWMNRPWNHVSTLQPRLNHKYQKNELIRRLKDNYAITSELEEIAKGKNIKINDVFQGDRIGSFTVLAPSYERYIDLLVESEEKPKAKLKESMVKVYERTKTKIKLLAAEWGEENLKGISHGTSHKNESSVVQISEMCGDKILLTGDAGIKALAEAYEFACQSGISLPGISRFQVPHHGSRRNLSSEMLDKWVGPKLGKESESSKFTAIISANQNDEDHPRNAVVRALIHRGARVFQTDGKHQTHSNAPKRQGWESAKVLEYPTDMED